MYDLTGNILPILKEYEILAVKLALFLREILNQSLNESFS